MTKYAVRQNEEWFYHTNIFLAVTISGSTSDVTVGEIFKKAPFFKFYK